jgi:hypothetical protein
MDSELIIKLKVKRFFGGFHFLVKKVNGADEFKENLNSNLYDIYENEDKLMFLYQVKKELEIILKEHKELLRSTRNIVK